MDDGECQSCGLFLDDTPVCPGCCAVQYAAGAVVNAPRCAGHDDRLAAFTCQQCGRYGCAQCEIEDSGGCYTCLPSRKAALAEELAQVRRRMLACVFAFAVAAPAVALYVHQVSLAGVLFVLSGCIMSLSVNAYLHRDFSAFAMGLTGVACLVLLLLMEHTWVALGPLFTAVSLFVQMNRTSWLEIEHWRTARLSRTQ